MYSDHLFRRRGLHPAVPPEPVAAVEDWDWQMEAPELPMPRLPFAPCNPSTSPKTTVATEDRPPFGHEGPGSPSVSTDVGDELRIPAQASMIDGLRLLLLHHLRDPLSPAQMELLERHLGQLASYAEKLVQLLQRMRAPAPTGARLKLKDEDLLEIYRSAQDEVRHGLPVQPVREAATEAAAPAKLRTPRGLCDPGAMS